MKIIISPAKKMREQDDVFAPRTQPILLEQTSQLVSYLKGLSYDTCKTIWKCNDKIASLNYDRIMQMDLANHNIPALFSYEGIQYQYMGPQVLDTASLTYLQDNLRILSGFYGILKPFDGIVPYRLEMQAKLIDFEVPNLYTFWGACIARELLAEDSIILNLASKEYSKCIEKYLTPNSQMVTCVFGTYKEDKVIEKGTEAKMARGSMVRYLAENKIKDLEKVKDFSALGYCYKEDLSTIEKYVFLKN